MIYTVECSFADAVSEAEWNDFYSFNKLPALISVSGFHTSQRFRAVSRGCPVYLALHTIDGIEVLTSAEYRDKGGGNFARWQQHICDWHRNLYDGLATAPAVDDDHYLMMTALGPGRLIELGAVPSAMRAVDLEKNPEERWLATLNRDRVPALGDLPGGVYLYAPMTAQLTSS